MIKRILSLNLLKFLLPVFTVLLLASCGKSTEAPAYQGRSQTYKLYNYSAGPAAEAGTFSFYELQDGNARVVISLNAGYRVPGVRLKSSIVTVAQGVELVYADLGDVDGSSGTGEKNPLLSSSTNAPISYNDILTKTGYSVKVLNGSNVQAKGTIQ